MAGEDVHLVDGSVDDFAALVAARRRHIWETSQRTARLVAERQAVEEVGAPLEVEHRRRERELAAVERECGDLRARMQRISEQIRDMDAEADALRRETVVLRAEASSARRQLDRLSREASTLEQDLDGQSAFGSSARASLRAMRGAVLRMEFKIDSRGEGEPA